MSGFTPIPGHVETYRERVRSAFVPFNRFIVTVDNGLDEDDPLNQVLSVIEVDAESGAERTAIRLSIPEAAAVIAALERAMAHEHSDHVHTHHH